MEYASELQLERKELVAPIYKLKQIQPNLGASTMSLTNGNPSTTFLIPGDAVYNLSQFFLQTDMVYLQTGALPANNSVNCIFADSLPIHQLILYAGSNYPLVTIEEAQLYSKVAQHMAVDHEEYFSRGPVYGDTGIGTNVPISQNYGCQPVGTYNSGYTVSTSNAQFTAVAQLSAANLVAMAATVDTTAGAANARPLTAAANPGVLTLTGNMASTVAGAANSRTTGQLLARYPTDASIIDVAAGGDVAAVASAFPATAASGSDITGRGAPQRVIVSAAEAGGGESNLAVRFTIPLSVFSGTLLALNKNILYGQNLQLKVIWKPIANWGFQCASVAAGASVALPIVNVAGVNYPKLQNLYLYASEDVNPDTVGALRAELDKGPVSINCPWVDGNQLTTNAAAGIYSIQSQLNPSDGIRLKRAITVAANGANTTKRTANTFNVGNVKYSSIQSKLDTQKLQENELTVADSMLWNYMRRLLRKSAAGLSSRTFEENMFFVDNFSDCQDSIHFKENDRYTSGLELQRQKTYTVTFNQTSTGGLLLVQWRVWLKPLILEKGRIYWGEQAPMQQPQQLVVQ